MKESFLPDMIRYLTAKYENEPERPWVRAPAYIVFRHRDNSRIYAILATVPASKLGIQAESTMDVLTVKVGDPLLREILLEREGFFPGLGFGQWAWVTIPLDGTVASEEMEALADRSFLLTASQKTKKRWSSPYA